MAVLDFATLNSPVTPSNTKRKSLNYSNRAFLNGTNRTSTPRGSTSKIQKAKYRKKSSFQNMDRDTYLTKYVKPNINLGNSISKNKQGLFTLRDFNRTTLNEKSSLYPLDHSSFNLVHLINSKGLTASSLPKITSSNTLPLKMATNNEKDHAVREEKTNSNTQNIDLNKNSFYTSKILNWKLSSKSNIFKKSLENKLDLIYPSKEEKVVENNVNNIRETRLVEKLNALNLFKSEGRKITDSLKTLFTPFSNFKFSLRQFIPYKYHDYQVSEDALRTWKDELVPFTAEMNDEVSYILQSDPNRLIVSAFSINIHTKDLLTLHATNWLNDGVIEFYFNLISSRAQSEKYPKVFAFGTYSFTLLEQGKSIGRWTRKMDFFSYEYLLMPIHKNSHWRLTVVNIPKKQIEYYDSLGGDFRLAVDQLFLFLQNESQTKKNEDLDKSEWKLVYNSSGIPQQNNSYDCGVFACKYAEYIARKAPITFKQDDIPYFRKCMIYEIVHKKLLID